MAYLAQGAIKVEVNLGTATPDWTNVSGVTVANGLGFSENRIDTTSFDSAPGTQESISGARPNVPLTFTMHDDPEDEAQLAIHAAPVNGVVTYSVSCTPDKAPTRSTVTP